MQLIKWYRGIPVVRNGPKRLEDAAHTHTHKRVVLETRGARKRRSHDVSEDKKRSAKAQHWSPKQIHQSIKYKRVAGSLL